MLSQKQFSQNHGSQKQHKPRQSQYIFYPLPALLLGLFISVSLNFSSLPAQAATVIEEIIVSAQRTDENLQDVPIAVTALTGAMLEDKGIISPSDLQMAAPNVSFTATNFGGSSFSIRGIGRLVIGTTGEAGVSTHVNEIPVATNLNLIEFFDVSRVEILRGPQGTLFGRNATGGSVNMVTNMPDYDNLSGFFDLEGGDYNNVRAKGALNIPFSDSAGLRLAGFRLQRNGYIENTAYGLVNDAGESLPNINDDVDGRNILALRATFSWDITENSNFWLQYNYFDEDDDRARLTNQVCKRTAVPALGCEPDESGFDTPHPGSTTAGIFFGLNARGPGGVGSLPLGYEGIPDGAGGIQQDYPQPARNSLREMHTDFEPVYKYEEDLYTLGYEYNFDSFTIGFLGAYQEVEYLSQMDYNMDVGPTLHPSPAALGFDGRWPTSVPAPGGSGSSFTSTECDYLAATAGIFGGCLNDDDGTRVFSMDQSDNNSDYWTVELRVASSLDGPFNFQAGVSAYSGEQYGDYYVQSNGLDSVALVGAQNLGFPALYPSMFNVPGNPYEPTLQTGRAAFAEVYFDLSERLKLTVGLRQNKDEKEPNSANAFFSSFDQSGILYGSYLPGVKQQLIAGGVAAQAGTIAAIVAQQLPGAIATTATAQGLDGTDQAVIDLLTPGVTEAVTAQVTAGVTAQVAAAINPLTADQTFATAAGAGSPAIDPDYVANLATLPGGQLPTDIGLQRRWSRVSTFLNPALIPALGPYNPELFYFHGVTPEELTAAEATLPYSAERIALSNRVGTVTGFNEVRALTGSPTKDEWSSVTGRIGLDYRLTEDILVYGFFVRGYKPGGFNPPIAPIFQSDTSFTFDEEEVDSLEVGFKSTLADGQLVLNGTAFLYDYTALQVTRIRNNSSINENIDADIMGLELEWTWQPEMLPNLSIDGSFSWLDTALDGASSVDVTSKTAGDPDWVNLKNIDAGALTGTNYIARLSQLTPDLVARAHMPGTGTTGPGTLSHLNGLAAPSSVYPTGHPAAGIPAYFSRNWLTVNGVDVSSGLPTDLDGNSLPNAPEFTLRVGVQYTLPVPALAGDLTLRWDYYLQDDSYAREFNTKGDEIDGWDQHNLSLIYESMNDNWQIRAFVRNIQDEDNVTGHYLTSDTSGYFRNYFLTEPRIYGVSLRYGFGG